MAMTAAERRARAAEAACRMAAATLELQLEGWADEIGRSYRIDPARIADRIRRVLRSTATGDAV